MNPPGLQPTRGIVVCRHATQVLPAEPESAPAARAFLRARATEWDLLPLLADAQLAVSELVTNAVIHARTPLVTSVSCADGVFELAVFDGNPTLPAVRPARSDLHGDITRVAQLEQELGPLDDRDPQLDVGAAGSVAGGRGLLLVAALAAEWGVSPTSDGKAVWARTPTPPGWPHASGCPCSTAERATTLASGHRVVHRTRHEPRPA